MAAVRESITMWNKRDGIFPRTFVWRGNRVEVSAVEACRTEHRQGRARRHIFRVRTDRGTFELAQEIGRDAWHVEQMWLRAH